MIKAAIFDMDGLLLDSEPFWKIAETKVFNSIGVPLTDEMCDTTVGMRIEEVTAHWHKKYPWDINRQGNSISEISKKVVENVIELINERAEPFKGVNYILDFFVSRKIKSAIASSSAMSIIDAVLDKFDIRNKFVAIHSAEFEEYGKPHPAIYINTAVSLNVKPEDCLAFEDSFVGLTSAKNAGMKTVVIPEQRFFNESRFDVADMKLSSLLDFTNIEFEKLNN